MPSSGQPPHSTIDHPTRQQLDELDALMQRMLALPVDPTEDPSDLHQQPQPRDSVVLSTSASSDCRPVAAKTESDPLSSPPILGSPSLSLATVESSVESSRLSAAPAVNVFAGLETARTLTETIARPSVPPAQDAPLLPMAWPLRPLLWLNLAFDYATGWLGPLGRWLRGPVGRGVLGWGGLLLLVAALAWIALLEGMGWTW
jgi:hypothetical protein